MDLDPKLVFSIAACVLSATTLLYYIHQTLTGKIKPHAYSWYIWSLASLVALIAQIHGNAGHALLFTAWLMVVSLVIATISLIKYKSVIQRSDIIYLGTCIFALLLIPVLKDPLISLIIVCAVDAIGFVPSIRKSWNDPYSDTALAFFVYIITNTLAILALKEINIYTISFPLVVATGSSIMCATLLLRRKMLHKTQP